jgi:hypothetical protein
MSEVNNILPVIQCIYQIYGIMSEVNNILPGITVDCIHIRYAA